MDQPVSDHEKLRFYCICGARLRAKPKHSGKVGVCHRCRQQLVVPRTSGGVASPVLVADSQVRPRQRGERVAAAVVDEATPDAVIETLCGFCQCAIDEEEQPHSCPACGLPFHSECWQENLGCSAYGCSQHNALRPGPSIRIEIPPDASQTRGLSPASTPPTTADEDEIPWDFILLGATVLCCLLGLGLYGLPCGVTGWIAALEIYRRWGRRPVRIYLASGALSLVGFFAGMMVATNF